MSRRSTRAGCSARAVARTSAVASTPTGLPTRAAVCLEFLVLGPCVLWDRIQLCTLRVRSECQYVVLHTRGVKQFFSSSKVEVGCFNMPCLWALVRFGSSGSCTPGCAYHQQFTFVQTSGSKSVNFWMKGMWHQNPVPPLLAVWISPDSLSLWGPLSSWARGEWCYLPHPGGCVED